MNPLSSTEALAEIRKRRISGTPILGVDGFQVVPEGFVARLDLILDVSSPPRSHEQAAAEAEAFILSKSEPDIVFEIV
jgi:hypothetical protein